MHVFMQKICVLLQITVGHNFLLRKISENTVIIPVSYLSIIDYNTGQLSVTNVKQDHEAFDTYEQLH